VSAEVREAVQRLLAHYGSFPASQLSREVASVGERTVRRHLAKMVADGELRVVSGGRSTRYAAGDGD
jgi:ATP-dependent DNA helicase RecG